MKQIAGIVPVLLTPMTREGEVDTTSLGKLVRHLNKKPVGGFWVLGTGGEDMSLSYRQRLEVVKTVVRANEGKTPLIVGTSFFSMRESLDFLDDTAEMKIDAYHAMPYHPLLSLERIEWWYKRLADRASKPLWMYTSANWARFIPPEFVEKLKNYKNIAGVKYSTSNAAHTERVIAMADNNFQVITAVVRTLYVSLCLGVKGATTVEACPFADRIINIYQLFENGDLPGALSAQREFNNFLDQMPTNPGKDNFLKVAEGKYILSKFGICEEYMSGYYRSLTDGEKKEIDSLLGNSFGI
jgi:dihydrodipicolinate synthase/N-acetylneuraminate lyase